MPCSIDTFRPYYNSWFVETGTYHGFGVACALSCGFNHIMSIELSPVLVIENRLRFKKCHHVEIVEGDSGLVLGKFIHKITKPITFWLDGHFSGGDTVQGSKVTPLLEELAQIKEHGIKTHTILIDDVRLFGTEFFGGVTQEQVETAIHEINPGYHFSKIDGNGDDFKQDILVAEL